MVYLKPRDTHIDYSTMMTKDTLLALPRRIKGFSDPVLEARFMELGISIGEVISIVGRAPFKGAHRVQTSRGQFGLRPSEWKSLVFEI